jgi:hypothetical protein
VSRADLGLLQPSAIELGAKQTNTHAPRDPSREGIADPPVGGRWEGVSRAKEENSQTHGGTDAAKEGRVSVECPRTSKECGGYSVQRKGCCRAASIR